MTTPIDAPAAHDVFKLGDLMSPFSRVAECNGRELTWQEMQAPGYLGAFVNFRGAKLVSITYAVELISRPGFALVEPLLARVHSMATARPPTGAKLIDLRLATLRIPQVAVARVPWQELVEPGKWAYKFKFQEYKRLQLAGGPVQAPRNPLEVKIQAAQNELKGERANADAAVAAARAAVGERRLRNKFVSP